MLMDSERVKLWKQLIVDRLLWSRSIFVVKREDKLNRNWLTERSSETFGYAN